MMVIYDIPHLMSNNDGSVSTVPELWFFLAATEYCFARVTVTAATTALMVRAVTVLHYSNIAIELCSRAGFIFYDYDLYRLLWAAGVLCLLRG